MASCPHVRIYIRTKRRVFNERASESDELVLARIHLSPAWNLFFFFGHGYLINNRVLSLPALCTFGLASPHMVNTSDNISSNLSL